MKVARIYLAVLLLVGGIQAQTKRSITVAAAANLGVVFGEIGKAFEAKSGIHVEFSFGATENLAKQIENGAPFDVFAAADTEHPEQLDKQHLLTPGSRVIYARGKLALWSPPSGIELRALQDLEKPEVKYIALARPELAPYGRAARETLEKAGLWERLQPKIVYAENVLMARQYAETGNAEASFTAYSLVLAAGGHLLLVDENLHAPIDQALGIVKQSANQEEARRFVEFLGSSPGREILERRGYITLAVR